MKFSSLLGNSLKLDGGAMFGVAPKPLWSRWVQSDELNRIDLACRSLLVETENHTILFETGVGAFMDPLYQERYGVQESRHVLLDSLASLGVSHEDITDIILSHLHFDHAGGLLSLWQEGKPSELLFPNAIYYVSDNAWNRSRHPHDRDQASFIPRLNILLESCGRLMKIRGDDVLNFDELKVNFIESQGHTPGMICSDLRWNNRRLVFAADMIPGRFWVHLPITMAYDRCTEYLVDEKKALLASVVEDGAWIFYTHDREVALSKANYNADKKRFEVAKIRKELIREEL